MTDEINALKKEIDKLNELQKLADRILDIHNQIFISLIKRIETLEKTNKIVDILEKVI